MGLSHVLLKFINNFGCCVLQRMWFCTVQSLIDFLMKKWYADMVNPLSSNVNSLQNYMQNESLMKQQLIKSY